MSKVRRVYVEKKEAFAVAAKGLAHEISSYLGVEDVTNVRQLIRYDVENISDEGAFRAVIPAVGCVGHCTYTRIDSLFYYRAKGFRLQAGMSAVAFYRTAEI